MPALAVKWTDASADPSSFFPLMNPHPLLPIVIGRGSSKTNGARALIPPFSGSKYGTSPKP